MRDDKERLLNILDIVEKIEKDFDITKFNHDSIYRFGVVKLIENIGEEVRYLSDDIKSKEKSIEWSSIIGMRNIIVHQYNEIDWDIILDIVDLKIPELRIVIGKLIND